MQAESDTLMPQPRTASATERRSFYQRRNGRWRGALTQDDPALYQVQQRPSFLGAWLAGGRPAARAMICPLDRGPLPR